MPDISGTFRSASEAEATVRQLKEAGFRIDQLGMDEAKSDLSVAKGREAVPSDTPVKRVMVTVHAEHRVRDAKSILERCGAFDVNVGDDVAAAVREPVSPDPADTPFGVTGDVANGLT